jgi:hypothetical protein
MPIGPVSILAHDGRILTAADLWLTMRHNVGKRPEDPGFVFLDGSTPDAIAARESAKKAAASA